jgi:2-haloacid dehalogenase
MDQQKPAFIFDIGGVLLDWNPRYLYRHLFHGDEAGMEYFLSHICNGEWNQRMDAGLPFLEGVAELSAQHPDYAGMIRAFYDRWEDMLGAPIAENVKLLEALSNAGYALYSLTNFSVEKFLVAKSRYPFLRRFQDVLVSAEVRLTKPDPRIYGLMLQRIGRRAGECIFLDDTKENVETARTLGFQPIWCHTPRQVRRDLASMGILLDI